MRDHLIRQFLVELGKELEIEGIDLERQGAVMGEVQSHLVEAFEAANPSNEAEEREVIRGFGTARTLARSLAGEYSRARSRRRYLWPVLFVLAALGFFLLILPQWRVTLCGRQIWAGTLYSSLCGMLLLVLGFRARRPLVGQFAALAAGLLVGGTCWLMLTCYPVTDRFAGFVKRNEVAREVAESNVRTGQDRLLASRLRFGQQFFSDPSERPTPSFLRSADGYMLPDGVREATYRLPARTGAGLTVQSWNDAVREWNLRPYTMENEGGTGRETSAELWMFRAVRDVDDQQNHIKALYGSIKEPWWIQLKWTVQLYAPGAIVVSTASALATNAGWLLWVLFVPIRRQVRRSQLTAG